MTTSLVPHNDDAEVYLVLDEVPTLGRVWRELGEEMANERTVINMISDGEFHRPIRIVVFNSAEGWCRDETKDIGFKLLDLSERGRELGRAARDFVERSTGYLPTEAFK